MQANNTQYYLYEDQSNGEDIAIVQEDQLLAQLEEAVLSRQGEYSEEELSAAVALMLLHYQLGTDAIVTPKNKILLQNEAPEINNANEQAHPMRHTISKQLQNNYTRSSILAACRNILKEFLSQNT